MATIKELEDAFVKADNAARAGNQQAAQDAAAFAAELKRLRGSEQPVVEQGAPVPASVVPARTTPAKPSLPSVPPPPSMAGNPLFIDFPSQARAAVDSLGLTSFHNEEQAPISGISRFDVMNAKNVDPEQAIKGAATVARYAPVAAAIAFPPAGALGFLGAGAGMAGGELAGRQIEGSFQGNADDLGAAAKSFVYGSARLPAIVGAPAEAKFLERASNYARQGFKLGGSMAATGALAKQAEQSINNEKLDGYDMLSNAWAEAKPAAILGGLIGSAGAFIKNMVNRKGAEEIQKARLQSVGVEDPPPGMIRGGGLANSEARIAVNDRQLADQIEAANQGVLAYARRFIGEAKDMGEIGPEMQKIVGVIKPLDEAMTAAEARAADARAAYEAAKSKVGSATDLAALEKEYTAANLNLINQKAAIELQTQAALRDFIPPHVMTKTMGEGVGKLINVREAISGELYNDFYAAAGNGFNGATGIIPKDELLQVATDALKANGGAHKSVNGREVLAAIADLPVGEQIGVIEKGPNKGKPIYDGIFSKNDIDALKSQLADKFASAVPGGMTRNQFEMNTVYQAVRKHLMDTLEQRFAGPGGTPSEAVQKLKHANEFTRVTSELEDSDFGRALLTKASSTPGDYSNSAIANFLQEQNMADNAISSIANKLIAGKTSELENYKKFVGALATYGKPLTLRDGTQVETGAIANGAEELMANAIHQALRAKHTTADGVNYQGLLGDLLKANEVGGPKMPFPVERLGYGDVNAIRNWRDAYATFKPSDITEDVTRRVLQNPGVQTVIEKGALDGKAIISKATAEEIFKDKIRAQVALQAAQLDGPAMQRASEARELANKQTGLANAARAEYEAARNNPLIAAFAGAGDYKFSNEARLDMGQPGTVNHFLGQLPKDDAVKLMGALREKNPQLAEIVDRRVLTDELNKLVGDRPGTQSGIGLDFNAIRKWLRPENVSDVSTMEKTVLRKKLGNEVAGKFESLLGKLADVEEGIYQGRAPSAKDDRILGGVLGATAIRQSGVNAGISGTQALASTLLDIVRNGHYNTIAAMIKDKSFADAILNHGLVGGTLGTAAAGFRSNADAINSILSSMPAQKAALISVDRPLMKELDEQFGQKKQ